MLRTAFRFGLAVVFGVGVAISAVALATSDASATPGFCAFKFIDLNGNGELDDGEPFAEGWEICVTGPDGFSDCKLTDEDGAACWLLLPLGEYEICETLQPGFANTTPLCQTVTLTSTEVLQIFFGNWEPPVPTHEKTWGQIKAVYR